MKKHNDIAEVDAPNIKISGHRGYRGKEIENTKAAFQRAIKEGLDYVELDVRKTLDGELVVFHDRKVNRLLNGKGNIEKFPLTKLKLLKYSDGQEILTLEEFFILTKGKIKLIIDIKSKGIEKTLIDLVKQHGLEGDVVIQAFSGKIVKNCQKIDPTLHYCVYRAFIGKLLYPHNFFARLLYNRMIKRYDVSHVSLDGPFMYDKFVSILNQNGHKIILGAIKAEKYLKKVKKWKISIINADNPSDIKEKMKNLFEGI